MNRNRWVVFAAAAGVGAATVLMQVVTAEPASAVPGRQVVTVPSAFDSSSPKSVIAYCPGGTRVLGGGVGLEGEDYPETDGMLQITRLQPSGITNSYTATVAEIGPYGHEWRFTVYAICAEEPPGLEYLSYHSFNNSNSAKSARVDCPPGTRVIGTGARTEGGNGQVIIDDIAPDAALMTLTATATEMAAGYGGNWSMWAYAVCAEPLTGLELRSAAIGPISDAGIVQVSCSSPAKQVIGVGAGLSGGLGQVMHLAMFPSSFPDTAVVATDEDANGLASSWTHTVYAICAS